MALIDNIIQIPMTDVLDKLWLSYTRVWATNEYSIDWADWWRFNQEKNFVEDFSHDRAEGNPFAFIRAYLKIDDSETYKRFEFNFGFENKKPVEDHRRQFWELNQNQVDYLSSRCIDANKLKGIVKNINWGIWCALYDWVNKIGIKIRRLTDDKGNRYISVPWYSWDGLYMHDIDITKWYIIVVEGMTDFLSLRQYDRNVVWLSSAVAGINEVKKLSKEFEIYVVNDNDEAGRAMLQKLNGIDYNLYDISEVDKKYKDVNDVLCWTWCWEDIIQSILDLSEYQAPINAAFDRFDEYLKKIIKQWKLGIDGLFPEMDIATSGIVPWKVYTIWAFSNVGKSNLSYAYCAHFLKANKKVLFLNLEVDTAMFMGNMICAMENISYHDMMQWHKYKKKLYKNLIVYDNLYSMDEIENVVMDTNADIVFIDFIQNIQNKWGWEYEKMASVARAVQRLAIQSWATIFSLSQLSNETAKAMKEWRDVLPSLKWWGELYASSDVVMILSRTWIDWELMYKIEKNKYGRVWQSWILQADLTKKQFTILEEI